MFPSKKNSKSHGFSLVEVVIALGLASFALVSMVGLLSVGFRGARDSIDMTVIADIARGISGEAQLTPWTNLQTIYGARIRYFDDLGRELSNDSQAAYLAKTSLNTPPTNVIFAGNHATNLLVEIWPLASPQNPTLSSRLLVKSD
jgi:uncharacterized protein (TIGR02598 family)